MPVLPNDEIEAKLRDQGLSVHIAYRQMRALESIAEIMNATRVARDAWIFGSYPGLRNEQGPIVDANPQKS